MNSAPLQQAFWDVSSAEDKRVAVLIDKPVGKPIWAQIEHALFRAMAVETCNVEHSEVVARIESEELGVMVSFAPGTEDVVAGVAILDEQDGWIDIPFLWSAGLPSLNALFDGAERLAKDLGQRGIKWTTANEQAIKYAKRRGHRQRQVEFVKEV